MNLFTNYFIQMIKVYFKLSLQFQVTYCSMLSNPETVQISQSNTEEQKKYSEQLCPKCQNSKILIAKYEKLVSLLQKKLNKISHTDIQDQSQSLFKKSNIFMKPKRVLTESNGKQLHSKVLSLKVKKPQASEPDHKQHIKEADDIGFINSAPCGFKPSGKLIRETRYFQMIKELKYELELKKHRISALQDQLYSQKNSKMHLRQIIHEFLICSGTSNQSCKKSQIGSLLIQFFEYSEEEREQIHNSRHQKTHMKIKNQMANIR